MVFNFCKDEYRSSSYTRISRYDQFILRNKMQHRYSDRRKSLLYLCGFYATHALNTRKLIGSFGPRNRFVPRIRSINGAEGVTSSTILDSLLYKQFQLSPLGALVSRRTWKCLATKVGTTKNQSRMHLVRSTTFSWLGFSSCLTGLCYILTNEPKCRGPSLSASHVSRSNTAQIGCRSRANSRISELCVSYVQTYNQNR